MTRPEEHHEFAPNSDGTLRAPGPTQCAVQQGVVLELLSHDRPYALPRAELERRLREINPALIGEALSCLRAMEVVRLDGDAVSASRCARHLFALGMVTV
jgi:hypothetical protein